MQYGNIARVILATHVADREPVSVAVDGLPMEYLFDCSWTSNPDVMGMGWWPVEDQSPALGRYQRYGTETLTVDAARGVVVSVSTIEPWTPEMIAVDMDRIRAEVIARTQVRLDEFARTRGYDGILSAATYYNSTIAQFAAEGHYAVLARDLTWQKLIQLNEDPDFLPVDYTDVEPLLPALAWPA